MATLFCKHSALTDTFRSYKSKHFSSASRPKKFTFKNYKRHYFVFKDTRLTMYRTQEESGEPPLMNVNLRGEEVLLWWMNQMMWLLKAIQNWLFVSAYIKFQTLSTKVNKAFKYVFLPKCSVVWSELRNHTLCWRHHALITCQGFWRSCSRGQK